MADLLTIGEIARRSGVAASALRFYEDRGLIRSERAGSGHRRYPRAVLRRIAFIVFAQRVGLGLDEIGRELAKLPGGTTPTGRDWARLSGLWKARIEERIEELERLSSSLTECIGCGCLSLERCQLATRGRHEPAFGEPRDRETHRALPGDDAGRGGCRARRLPRRLAVLAGDLLRAPRLPHPSWRAEQCFRRTPSQTAVSNRASVHAVIALRIYEANVGECNSARRVARGHGGWPITL